MSEDVNQNPENVNEGEELDNILVLNDEETEDIHDHMTDIVVDYELESGKTLSVITVSNKEYSIWKNTLPFYINMNKEGITIWKEQ